MVADLVFNRQLAIKEGHVKYIGHDCSKGHGNERYVKNGSCVQCAKIAKAAHNAKIKTHFACEEYLIAKQNKETHFTRIKPCIKCNEHLFYTGAKACVKCVSDANLRSAENQALADKSEAWGNTTYIPNKPCNYGHSLRYVNSNNCIECGKLIRFRMKDKIKIKRIYTLYGLSEEAYWELVDSQKSCCKLCKEYSEDNFKLHVDHCHNTKKVRGLLCTNCNRGIGHLKHNPKLLRDAALHCEET